MSSLLETQESRIQPTKKLVGHPIGLRVLEAMRHQHEMDGSDVSRLSTHACLSSPLLSPLV
jgi:hypothetical protein